MPVNNPINKFALVAVLALAIGACGDAPAPAVTTPPPVTIAAPEVARHLPDRIRSVHLKCEKPATGSS